VLGVNAAERRISLGLKQALGDPWEEAARKYAPGNIVEGPVSSLTNFGCFVTLGDGLEGMIHISDITREKRLNHPREAVTAGQKVRAVVLELDQERRRIKLGIKQLEPTTADEYIGEHQAGETVTGRIVEGRPWPSQGGVGRRRLRGVPATRARRRSRSCPSARPRGRSLVTNRHAFSQMEAGLAGGEIAAGGAGPRRTNPHFPNPETRPGRQEN